VQRGDRDALDPGLVMPGAVRVQPLAQIDHGRIGERDDRDLGRVRSLGQQPTNPFLDRLRLAGPRPRDQADLGFTRVSGRELDRFRGTDILKSERHGNRKLYHRPGAARESRNVHGVACVMMSAGSCSASLSPAPFPS
jgi:hypothetical protein